MRRGVIPDWKIKELIQQGIIQNADPSLVNTSSLDLRLGLDKWKLLGSFLPLLGQTVEDALNLSEISDARDSTRERFYIEPIQQYAMRVVELLDLPQGISAKVFNKSGRGRIGVSLRGLTDGAPKFDVVDGGYKGPLFAEICSTSFPLVINAGQTAVPQIRFYEGNPEPMSGSELEMLLRNHPILTDDEGRPAYTEAERDNMIRTGKLVFTADIHREGLAVYIALRDRRTLDLAKKNHYIPEDFFARVINEGRKGVLIHPGDFILIKSRQHIRLPPCVAAEIDEYAPECGDMKSSYANLVNATHGYDPDHTNTPSALVFEIRARDVPIFIQHGQRLATFELYKMLEEPEGRYMDRKSTDFRDLRSILPNIFKKD
ncbi:MAG TPA: 2'-deoxycytidine 5'-triphosphate deaminase [Candidatus Nanoarchaeia archaeon]|nr:2'-deoxycytidine 5'-triphosphate deaminase [Candidatus Nanoarchaeia archaeon]